MSAAPRRIAVFIGTRPEAVKLAPVVSALRARADDFEVRVCLLAQHRQILDQTLKWFPELDIDIDSPLMQPDQSLVQSTSAALVQADALLNTDGFDADWAIVQGDTNTAAACALAAFYNSVPVAHVEAGLRTESLKAPFPEEANRRIISQLASIHFCPTQCAAENLARAGIDEQVNVVGNTVIDALLEVRARIAGDAALRTAVNADIARAGYSLEQSREAVRPFVLITGHRRESFGAGLDRVCSGIVRLAEAHPGVDWVYAVHLNPNVRQVVHGRLSGRRNIYLLEPLEYGPFVEMMGSCRLILTDSGGIQEEAPALGKPVLVMRQSTERPEAVEAGAARLVGTDADAIFKAASELLSDEAVYRQMAQPREIFGDGSAARRIAEILAAQQG
ncbi:MAG: UDP-N-acetylglucosamine 2-epimerase (non-hydrolyzing) [Gammaproteobacteria bacterium AqS3]|nr:UDP-N-acetylglucosamine 2-epimerase (non-hydrolyzing) [Gammaproteobacteria bacterium AqS3]